MKTPVEIVRLMLSADTFSKWMGLEIIDISKGSCTLQCIVHPEMLNGFEILHGGISYSLSDSALAFSSNSYGYKCVSIETSISHIRPVKLNETLTVKSEEVHRGKSFGIYSITVTNQNGILISKFKGTVNISKEIW